MAYVSKQDKADLAPAIKAVLKKYNMKGSISVRNHSTLVVKVTQGALDFAPYSTGTNDTFNYIQVNEYWIDAHYEGAVRNFLNELLEAMKGSAYFNDDDAMTDYFSRSHYCSIEVGQFSKPYKFTGCNIPLDMRIDPSKAAYIIAA